MATTTPGDDAGSRSRSWDNYIILQKIGSGAFSTVYKARHKDTGLIYAIKAIKRDRLTRKQQENLKLEQTILKDLDHPSVVRLYEIMKTDTHIYLIMEHCEGGDLSSLLARRGALTEVEAVHVLREVARGLVVLQSSKLIHRDLKPQNLLLTSPDILAASVKIADFGLARYISEEDLAQTLCGSPSYMSPECLAGHAYSATTDLWSVGAILFELLTGTPPYVASNHIELLRRMQRAPPTFPRTARLSSTTRHLVHSCLLVVDPAARMTFDEFFAHPYIKATGSAREIVSELALASPTQRSFSELRPGGAFASSSGLGAESTSAGGSCSRSQPGAGGVSADSRDEASASLSAGVRTSGDSVSAATATGELAPVTPNGSAAVSAKDATAGATGVAAGLGAGASGLTVGPPADALAQPGETDRAAWQRHAMERIAKLNAMLLTYGAAAVEPSVSGPIGAAAAAARATGGDSALSQQ